MAAGLALIVLILLVLGVRGCLDARQERAYRDYVRDVQSIVQESNQQGEQLFALLSGPGGQDEAVDVENSLNTFRAQSAQLVDRARDTSHPGDLDSAQRYLVEALEFRRDGLAAIADNLPNALADQDRREGTRRVTAQMQAFLASDVVYSQRFNPSLRSVLEEEELGSERVPESQFLPDVDWLQPDFVAEQVEGVRTGSDGDGAAAPGLHGNGLGTVSVGGVALTPGGTATVSLGEDLSFDVQVANQGEHTETDVTVRVTLGSGGDAIEETAQLDTIAAGETKSVTVPLTEQPPTGQNVEITVEIEPVPGEEMTDNNVGEFSAIFTS